MKIGLEKEFFLLLNGEPISLNSLKDFGLPYDDCGWLVEARGNPFHDPVDAIFSLKAEVFKIEQQLIAINANRSEGFLTLSDNPLMKVSKSVRLQASRRFAKGLTKYQNLYGHESHKNAMQEATAGVHVSFTQENWYGNKCESCGHCKTQTYNVNFDWPQIFIKLDEAFADEIKESKRRPGFYEIKSDGRVEYRSLPANVDLDKLIKVLKSLI
jgi:hypothetical protein